MSMTWMQDRVRDFHVALGQPAPDGLDLDGFRAELRARLIMEEAIETVNALGFTVEVSSRYGVAQVGLTQSTAPDWPEVVDGLCDVAYVTLGAAVEAGFSLAPFFHEVHRSNMTKIGGPVRESDGKVLKPDSFEPPRIAYLWDRLVARAADRRPR